MRTRNLIPWSDNRSLLPGDWSPDRVFDNMREEMNRMFDDLSHRFHLTSRSNGEATIAVPRVDVVEEDKEVRVTAELPGLTEDDIEATFADGMLTVSGERKHESEDKDDGGRYFVRERAYGAFKRRLAIDAPVDEDKVEAKFDNGLLTITLPKAEEDASKVKRIPIKR